MISADASAVRYGKNSIAIGQSGDGRVVTTTNPVTDGAGNSTSQALTITIDGSAQLLSAGFPYAFQFKGYDSNGPVLMLGSFIPQSDGSSFKGMIEIHSVTNNGRSSANFTGNYTVGADGRGTLTAPSLSGSPVFAFAFDSVGNTASVIEFDNSGQRGTGFMIRDEVARSFPLNTVINAYWLPTIRAAIELIAAIPQLLCKFSAQQSPTNWATRTHKSKLADSCIHRIYAVKLTWHCIDATRLRKSLRRLLIIAVYWKIVR